MARPEILNKELADKICIRLAGGESLRKICKDDEMPAQSSVLLWVVKGHGGNHNYTWFSEQYAQAREANGHAHGDRVTELAMEVLTGKYNPQQVKVAMDGLKWAAEKMAPKNYGQRVQQEVTGKGGGPLEIKDLTDNDLARRLAFSLRAAIEGESEVVSVE